MAGVSIRMNTAQPCPLAKIHESIHSIPGMEQISKVVHTLPEAEIWLLVYEKYFIRSGSFASLSVLLTTQENRITADIVSAGGGESISNFSYGANRKLARECMEALSALGFTLDPENSGEGPKGLIERFLK